jgi:hypothetical protein
VTAVVACTPTTQQRKEVWQMPEGDAISSLAPLCCGSLERGQTEGKWTAPLIRACRPVCVVCRLARCASYDRVKQTLLISKASGGSLEDELKAPPDGTQQADGAR